MLYKWLGTVTWPGYQQKLFCYLKYHSYLIVVDFYIVGNFRRSVTLRWLCGRWVFNITQIMPNDCRNAYLDIGNMAQTRQIIMTSWHENVFRITCPSWGNPLVTGGFPSQRASNAFLWSTVCCYMYLNKLWALGPSRGSNMCVCYMIWPGL